MAESPAKEVRERLLALDPLPARVRSRCEAAIQKLLVRKLSPAQRLWGWVTVLVNLVIAWGLLDRMAGRGGPLDMPTELVATSTALLLGLSAWLAYVLMRRSIHVLRDQALMDTIGFIGVFALGGVLLWFTWQGDDFAYDLGLAALIVLVFGVVPTWALILSIRRRRVIQSRVKLLEQELLLCEPAGEVDKDPGPVA